MSEFIRALQVVSVSTGRQILYFGTPVVILILMIQLTSGRIERSGIVLLGKRFYLLLFGWPGTICHELAHAVFCVLFRHKINEIKLFSLDPETESLGYVNHSYDSKSIYQSVGNFFIGIAPVFCGSFVIYLAARFLLDIDFAAFHGFVDNVKLCFTTSFSFAAIGKLFLSVKVILLKIAGEVCYTSWKFWLFAYISFSVGSGITLSGSDMKGAAAGGGLLLILIFLSNLTIFFITRHTHLLDGKIVPLLSAFSAVLIFVIALNLIFGIILGIMCVLKRAVIKN